MKKGVKFVFVFLSLIFFISAISAADIQSKAYDCLNKQINTKTCSALTLEEKTFSLLSAGKCSSELLALKKPEGCWGKTTSCDIKSTAQALIALKMQGQSVGNYSSWILSKTGNSSDLDWLLQIQATNSTCRINISKDYYVFTIGEDDRLNFTEGNSVCFNYDSTSPYWLFIKSNCYDKNFSISCDKEFSTSTLFKKKGSSTIHVLEESQTALANEALSQNIRSSCLKTGSSCDYESNLWGVFALYYAGEDVSSYLPYLTAMKDTDKKYLGDSFLYYLTGDEDFANAVLTKQKTGGYWDLSGNKFYDTALALFPFSSKTDLPERTNAINWLTKVQGTDGCWNSGNIRDTAFLLISVWPKTLTPTETEKPSCDSVNYYCVSFGICSKSGGNELADYACAGFNVCCDKPEKRSTCEEAGGTFCQADEECQERILTSSDISDSEKGTCCSGECAIPNISEPEQSDCELQNGTCSSSCSSKETAIPYDCTNTEDICCTPKKTSLLWLWILLGILIISLAIVLVIKKRKKGPTPGPYKQTKPLIPRRPKPNVPTTKLSQRIQQKPQIAKTSQQPASKEEDVFKRLREMK